MLLLTKCLASLASHLSNYIISPTKLFGKEEAYHPFCQKINVSAHLVCHLLSYVFKAIMHLKFDRLSNVQISNVKWFINERHIWCWIYNLCVNFPLINDIKTVGLFTRRWLLPRSICSLAVRKLAVLVCLHLDNNRISHSLRNYHSSLLQSLFQD